MRRIALAVLVVVTCIGVVAVAGCTKSEPAVVLEPQVAPPTIGTAGVLRAAIDLDYPPFAGTDKGRQAGLDIDVAAALAAELGLKLEVVEAKDRGLPELKAGNADIAMSVPFTEQAIIEATFAGTYVNDGPGFFVSAEETGSVVETLTIDSVGGMTIGAQKDSEAFWALKYEYGEGTVQSFASLREALQALSDGSVEAVCGDSIVAAYIARDFPSVRYAGQAGTATALGVAVAVDNTELEGAVRQALDTLAANGVLETLRKKWVGELPELVVEEESAQ
ncbi:MAG: transporter substrate-binding domain-containing protein [Coriobacteriia bacterium]|nr:transporter substrate-binding domain-containing protein [Coriobacteriia bacterium]